MAAAHSIVSVPELRCVILDVDRSLIPPETGLAPDDGVVTQFVEEMQGELPGGLRPDGGVILQLESMFSVFDGRFNEVQYTLALPLQDGFTLPEAFNGLTLEAAKVLELRYPPSRPFGAVLQDVYAQASAYSTESKLRDLGNFLRIHDLRGTREGAGYVVHVETVLRGQGGG